MTRRVSDVSYRARPFDDTASCSEGDGPPCDHGPECEVRYLWHLDGETDDEFVARLKFAYGGLEIPA